MRTMTAGMLAATGSVALVERPLPRARGDLVVVRVDITPMCTEFRLRGDGEAHDELGHEAVGVVVDAGDSTRLTTGDRVVVMPGFACGHCQFCARGEHIFCLEQRDVLRESGSEAGAGTYAQYLVKPDYLLLPIPDDISSEHAAAAVCLLGPSFNALRAMDICPGEALIVGGCGPVGLGAVIAGMARGARVLAVDRTPYRRELAARLGAEVFDPLEDDLADSVRRATNGDATAAFESRPSTQLVPFIERLGRMAVVAWGAELTFAPLVPQGLTVYWCWHWNHQKDGDRMWELIRQAEPLIDRAITHHFDLADLGQAMDVQASKQCGKVLLYPHERTAV